jgi:hypothetical protein
MLNGLAASHHTAINTLTHNKSFQKYFSKMWGLYSPRIVFRRFFRNFKFCFFQKMRFETRIVSFFFFKLIDFFLIIFPNEKLELNLKTFLEFEAKEQKRVKISMTCVCVKFCSIFINFHKKYILV